MNNKKLPRRRMREIDIAKLSSIKEMMRFSWNDIAELLCVSNTQLYHYRSCGRLPASRYYAMKDALLLACEDELREKRQRITQLFS